METLYFLLFVVIITQIILFRMFLNERKKSQLARVYVAALTRLMAWRSHDIKSIIDYSDSLNRVKFKDFIYDRDFDDQDIPYFDTVFEEVHGILQENPSVFSKTFGIKWGKEEAANKYLHASFIGFLQRKANGTYKETEVRPLLFTKEEDWGAE